MARVREVRFVDLFSGAGGLAQGFRQASDRKFRFVSAFAVELEEPFADSYKKNFGDHVFVGRIEDVGQKDLPDDIDLVIGGPPCQGFSTLGKMSRTDHHAHLNSLWEHYFKVVKWLHPKVFVIENVPQFLNSVQYQEAVKVAQASGYKVKGGVLNAWDFGVPQIRRRGFVIGVRDGTPEPRLPVPNARRRKVTTGNAIRRFGNKPLVYNFDNGRGELTRKGVHRVIDLHLGRHPTEISLERYKLIPYGGNRFDLMKRNRSITPRCWLDKPFGSTDVFGRLEWEKPSVTIRTEFFKPEKGRYLHPEQHRPITHLEAAKLQTFPDHYKFCGSKIEIARQIGNAVPPNLAEAVARAVRRIFLEDSFQFVIPLGD
jgi:DNA (cytosine-5)-methyltransferase 1